MQSSTPSKYTVAPEGVDSKEMWSLVPVKMVAQLDTRIENATSVTSRELNLFIRCFRLFCSLASFELILYF